jgi:hypothetical protein
MAPSWHRLAAEPSCRYRLAVVELEGGEREMEAAFFVDATGCGDVVWRGRVGEAGAVDINEVRGGEYVYMMRAVSASEGECECK